MKPPTRSDSNTIHHWGSGVLCIRWKDNNIVHFVTIVHPWNEVTLKERKKPQSASTNAAAIRRAYGTKERMPMFIPTAVGESRSQGRGR